MGKSNKPQKTSSFPIRVHEDGHNYDLSTPRFCLAHLQSGFGVRDLDQEGQASLAKAIDARAKMMWREITLAPKMGLGSELIPRDAIIPPIPPRFADVEKFLSIRYDGKAPMIGVRAQDTFHVLWIERVFGDVYNHGR